MKLWLAVAGAAIIFLASCGGGGASQSNSDELASLVTRLQPEVTIPREAPALPTDFSGIWIEPSPLDAAFLFFDLKTPNLVLVGDCDFGQNFGIVDDQGRTRLCYSQRGTGLNISAGPGNGVFWYRLLIEEEDGGFRVTDAALIARR